MPKVSIITTIYNRDRYLAQAIASILAQTYNDFELILFDDGSNDHSLEIAKEYAQKDSRIKAIASPHIGRIPALIRASALATGKYLALVDSDDWISANCLTETVSVLDNKPDIGMVYTNCQYVNSDGNILGARKQSQIPYSRDRLLIDFIAFHFRMYRRSLFTFVDGYDLKQEYCEDYDLTLKLSEITKVEFVPQATYYYRQHQETQGATLRIERIYWTKKAIENSLKRTSDCRKIQVYIPEARFAICSSG